MMKNYTKYGPTGIVWALYLIVGVVAYLVSNFYFKFEIKDAIIFGIVNLVAVVLVTEGIDWIFKKAKRRKESKTPEEAVAADAEPLADGSEPETSADKELGFAENLNEHLDDTILVGAIRAAEPSVDTSDSGNKEAVAESAVVEDSVNHETTVDNESPTLITGAPGLGNRYWSGAHLAAEKIMGSDDSEAKETPVVDEIPETEESPVVPPILITGRPGAGRGYGSGAHLDTLKEEESTDSTNKEFNVDTEAANISVESPASEESLTQHSEQGTDISSKPRGRRANPAAIIDAPTSSVPVITPDMIKPRVEKAEEPVAEAIVEEPIEEEPYLSAEEFLDTTKLTSPRAIVREYQRLGGKDDIYSILMERQK
jgi:hypothetical protein